MAPMEPGAELGHYTVLSEIGRGGMGVVWKARDNTLGREVAIKTLPPEFANDSERLARFEREAKLLASLNHPNIAAIYGLEEHQGTRFLVLELVEGDTLADRLARGAIPEDETLKLAFQVADALEAAHEKGVIHRDLKPANIKVTPDDRVKVLDFGLAKAFAGDDGGVNAANSPTLSMQATQQGVILGTASYMSPEQARGRSTDKRTDIWAFGVVLHEMLTGRQLFKGEDISEILAKVIRDEPAMADIPQHLHYVLGKCLAKDPKERLRDIGDFRLVMDSPATTSAPSGADHQRQSMWKTFVPWAVAVSAVIVAAVALSSREPVPTEPMPVRFSVATQGELPLRIGKLLALSPDGRELVYRSVAAGADQLYRRPLNALESVPITGSEGAWQAVFSPDGQSVLFGGPRGLTRVSLAGGTPTAICSCDTNNPVWGPDQTIVFSTGGGLSMAPATGGDPVRLTTLENGEIYHAEPAFVPGANALVFANWYGFLDTARLNVVSLDTGERKDLGPGFFPRFLPTGHLVYAQTGASMWAVAFDAVRLEIVGEPVRVLEGVRIEGGSSVQFSIADNGTMAYIPSGRNEIRRELQWIDSSGDATSLEVDALRYSGLQLSPDGTRVALEIEAQEGLEDLWIYDLSQGNMSQLTLDPAADMDPLWTPDGNDVLFVSDRNGQTEVFRRRADGTERAESLGTISQNATLSSVSPDGAILLYEALRFGTGWDIMQVPLSGDGSSEALLASSSSEQHAQISPDGRWLAYASDELGQREILVRPFPNVEGGGPYRISLNGGEEPVWSPSGEAIYFRQGNALRKASLNFPSGVVVTERETLFEQDDFLRSVEFRVNTYDIDPNTERFLMIRDDGSNREIVVVQDWLEEIRDLLP